MISVFVMQLLGESRTVLVDRMVRHGEGYVHVLSSVSRPVFIILIVYEFTTTSALEITVCHGSELCGVTNPHWHSQLGNFATPPSAFGTNRSRVNAIPKRGNDMGPYPGQG
jgi:hypothetical protein